MQRNADSGRSATVAATAARPPGSTVNYESSRVDGAALLQVSSRCPSTFSLCVREGQSSVALSWVVASTWGVGTLEHLAPIRWFAAPLFPSLPSTHGKAKAKARENATDRRTMDLWLWLWVPVSGQLVTCKLPPIPAISAAYVPVCVYWYSIIHM